MCENYVGEFQMNYSEKLKDIRSYEDLTQSDIAKILNVSEKTYGLYENQFKIIPLYHLNTLANFYNISVDYILGLTDIKCYDNYNKLKSLNKELIGNNLKLFRKEYKITLVKLAQLLNTSHSTLSAYEHGKTLILTSFLYTICKEYKVSADYLLGKVKEPKYLR